MKLKTLSRLSMMNRYKKKKKKENRNLLNTCWNITANEKRRRHCSIYNNTNIHSERKLQMRSNKLWGTPQESSLVNKTVHHRLSKASELYKAMNQDSLQLQIGILYIRCKSNAKNHQSSEPCCAHTINQKTLVNFEILHKLIINNVC